MTATPLDLPRWDPDSVTVLPATPPPVVRVPAVGSPARGSRRGRGPGRRNRPEALGVGLLRASRGRQLRRGYAIRGYVGANGHGKSATAVWDLLPSLEVGRPVLSTARLLDYRNPRVCDDPTCDWPGHPDHQAAHPLWVPFTDWRQFLDFRDGDVFLDEVAGVASSRESGNLPFQVARDLQQLRRRNVTLLYTAPAFARTEKIIRECTTLVVHCRGMAARKLRSEANASMWSDRRLFMVRSYDAATFDDFTNNKRAQLKAVNLDWFWRPGSIVEGAYDTFADVLSLGWANESGICLSCGGRRRVAQCSCDSPGRRRSGASDHH